eukprot:466282-Karenia_brevis.AAC.1
MGLMPTTAASPILQFSKPTASSQFQNRDLLKVCGHGCQNLNLRLGRCWAQIFQTKAGLCTSRARHKLDAETLRRPSIFSSPSTKVANGKRFLLWPQMTRGS